MSKIFFNILPFIFPLLAIYIIWSGGWSGIGKYTLTIAEWLIILGVVYSIYDILLQKKAVVASIINIFFIVLIVITGGILFYLMLKSGI